MRGRRGGEAVSAPRFATSTGRASLIHVTDGETERPVALCYGADDLDGDGEMAARIAAALNFVEGVPTEELTGSLLTLAAATTLAAEELRKLRQANDDIEEKRIAKRSFFLNTEYRGAPV